jgi:cytochrome c peroxidase
VGSHHSGIWRGLALLAGLAAAAGAAAQPPPLSEAEIRAILSHGPWPVPIRADPGNRVSGRREAVAFGERLFFDQRLSAGGKFSCGTCHVPERNWTDNRARGVAIAEVDRNVPTLMNVRLGRAFGWDGAAESLPAQSLRPILDARELGSTPRHVAELVRRDEQLACRYRKAFGAAPSPSDDQAVLADVGRALAAFQETFETPPTPFDRFRDALARGERITPLIYSEAAQRGARLFVGKGGCSACHSGPNFSDGGFHDNGFSAYASAGRADPGRDGRFKVPTLRHLFLTAPYGHHGEVGTLADAVRHYAERGSKEIPALKLSAAEQTDLVVFLESLSTFSNPWRPDDLARCR